MSIPEAWEDEWYEYEEGERADAKEEKARAELERLFEERREEVFYSRQIEVQLEEKYFHWVTNRALRGLVGGLVRTEVRPIKHGGEVHLFWHRGYRYYRRDAARLVKLVEEYADPNISSTIGLWGELMVLEGFARSGFLTKGRNTREHGDRRWEKTGHDLDFIFARDGLEYGVEVKNTLGYMDHDELETKIEMCQLLGLKTLLVARMLPKSWIREVIDAGGFALILKYQLYPPTHKELAKKLAQRLGLPVDTPQRLKDGTMQRFLRWHQREV